ncbi:MAG: Na/Pi cotransporter family protein [Thermus sp.]|uniref:PhoU domain-containing protein n=1 Tax=Thermus sp. TaxID=275 RepID=UPI0025EA217E|nr:PhoU domain-containing protein [Thermus sp.]MCS6867842.1 Na/Pi cotransporter family protein [Thermus sp.]MCS7218758.1 Na/Pi cotransporter family protein [Thermus sp.]MDW8358435.1 PhoU domain-containing protein [Thermus sp.]
MEFLAGLGLFLLGLEQIQGGLARLPGRRHLLGRALGRSLGALFFGFLLGLLSGSGSGLSLLALGLLEGRVLTLPLAALLSLAATAGATFWVGVLVLGGPGGAELFLGLGLLLGLLPWGRPLGQVLLGLGLLLLGFGLMGGGAEGVARLLGGLSLPLWGYYLLGVVLALLLGSANGVVALGLALGPALSGAAGVALVLGAGVGTTGSLLLAALGGRREAWRLFLVVGAHRLLLSLPLLALAPWLGGVGTVGLHALSHLFYALLFPLWAGAYGRLAERLFPSPQVAPRYLSKEALDSPRLAQALVQRELARVADAVRDMLAKALRILSQEEGGERELSELEEKVDRLTREVVLYTAELSTKTPDERTVRLFVAASELEHLGDLVRRVVRQAERLWAQGLTFSQEGKEDLLEGLRRVLGRLEGMAAALATGEKALAQEVLAQSKEEEGFLDRLRRAHLARLEGGRQETRASTLAHLDLLITLEELSAGIDRLCRLVLEL